MITHTTLGESFEGSYDYLRSLFLRPQASRVDTGHWQAVKDVPMTKTVELMNVHLEMPIPDSVEEAQKFLNPNLPWAEDHFQERVAGVPTNPGREYKNWPWFDPNWEAQGEDEKFSHTYQERFWPVNAGEWQFRDEDGVLQDGFHPPHQGIRYRYGDLHDLLVLLSQEPNTRQAYLPIFFPEDTGAHHGQRIPCTLGYHFMLRAGKLQCFYPMRSCDFVRYLRDDAYMAMRLTQWIDEQLSPEWSSKCSGPGHLTMTISSLHCFEGDLPKLKREAAEHVY